jgi:hypothetical protein
MRKRVQRLLIELHEDRAQAAQGLVQRPESFLMLAGEGLDRSGVLADAGTGRCMSRSVRRMCARIAASPRSDLPPA